MNDIEKFKTGLIENRRLQVARLLIRGLSQREIAEALGQMKIYNPETGVPFCLATIHKDINQIRRRWRDESDEIVTQAFAVDLMKLEELERACWASRDHQMVLRVIKRRGEMLGYDAPKRIEVVDWRQEAINHGYDPDELKRQFISSMLAQEHVMLPDPDA